MALVLATGGFVDMDDKTAELLLKLQIEDLDELMEQSNRKGKGKAGELTDMQLAFKLGKDELSRNLQVLQDRRMTRSIAHAVMTDANILATNKLLEQKAVEDRAFACRLGGMPTQRLICAPPTSTIGTGKELELIEKLSAIYVDCPYGNTASTVNGSVVASEHGGDASESSAWAASRQLVRIDKRECIMCAEEVPFFEIARLQCDHECCQVCLTDMFKASIVNEARYPPKCCEAISPHDDNVRIFLDSTIVKDYEIKKIEWDTKKRTYCSNLLCGCFIQQSSIIADHACCPICNTMTCAICQKKDHDGDCPEDEELKKTLVLLEEQGWRRCKSCNLGFDLLYGCNHITCPKPCGAEFCYVCEQK